jgi:hypothetical protein
MDFLVSRSRRFDEDISGRGYDPRRPPLVEPGAADPPVHAMPPPERS